MKEYEMKRWEHYGMGDCQYGNHWNYEELVYIKGNLGGRSHTTIVILWYYAWVWVRSRIRQRDESLKYR